MGDSPPQILKSCDVDAVRVTTGRIRPRAVAALCIATALCVALLILVLQLWRADLRIPIYYGTQSDLTAVSAGIKNLIDNGSYLRNSRLGAPGISETYDYPGNNVLHYAIMKAIGFIVGSWGLTLNLYFFLGFVFSVWSALLVLRQFKVAYPLAIAASLLFAFAPYHFYRNENHLELSAYYLIPPTVLVLVWLLRRDIRKLWSPKGVVSIGVCALVGCAGVYYAFFAVLLLALPVLYGLLKDRSFQRARVAPYLIVVTSAVLLLGLVPTWIYTAQHGKNAEIAVRVPHEAEVHAFKMTQLVFPVTGHRVPVLARIKACYNKSLSPSPISEGDGSALGMIGAAGFVFLLLLPLTGLSGARHRSVFRALALLNLCAFLIGTVGGVGSIFAWLCSPLIRAYSRIGIYIAFVSIAAMALLADEFWQRWGTNRIRRGILTLALVPVAALGILDQTTRADIPPYDRVKSLYRNDAEFFARVERSLPGSAMVLQLPYMFYPEGGGVRGMADYDPLRGYLHSTNLRWSYGAIGGRHTDAWLRDLESRPIEDIAEGAAAAGFSGIYLDRAGYSDRAAELESRLRALLARQPIVSTDGRYAFYELSPIVEHVHRAYSVK
jgi:phosphoglycerol transferase